MYKELLDLFELIDLKNLNIIFELNIFQRISYFFNEFEYFDSNILCGDWGFINEKRINKNVNCICDEEWFIKKAISKSLNLKNEDILLKKDKFSNIENILKLNFFPIYQINDDTYYFSLKDTTANQNIINKVNKCLQSQIVKNNEIKEYQNKFINEIETCFSINVI